MPRILGSLVVLALLSFSVPTLASGEHHMPGANTAQKAITGEVVDMGCWLGHAARGEKHISCATKCLNQGMPMGLLTSNGTLYLVTLDHDNADPYNQLKGLAGRNVTVKGAMLTRSGMKGIEASAVQVAGK